MGRIDSEFSDSDTSDVLFLQEPDEEEEEEDDEEEDDDDDNPDDDGYSE
jgi:hypothetical protein